MGRLVVFNHMTLDGYVADAKGGMSWAHRAAGDAEWDAFVEGNAAGGGILVFGRVTYDMMAGYWPTPHATQTFPKVAERMNALPKLVFSRSLNAVSWVNTRLVKGDPAAEIRAFKANAGPDMAILGSASIVAQAAEAGLVDEYQIVLNPVALGAGKTMFAGLTGNLSLKLAGTRTFRNGNILLTYQPVG